MPQSLFGHLALSFGEHPEYLATEALAFVLGRSPTARSALLRLLAQANMSVPGELHFRTQSRDRDKAIPDLVGVTLSGSQPLICEVKFWAALTEHQPITYLRRLPEGEPAVLLFIAPSRRLPTLWPELLRRCEQTGFPASEQTPHAAEMLVAHVSANASLALTSWRLVLGALLYALESEGEREVAADVRQLEGLCERMDSEAFLPIRSDELSPSIASRLLQFNHLVDDLTQELVRKGVASTKDLRATPIFEGYGRYMKIGSHGCMLQVNAEFWSRLGETPLWLGIKDITASGWRFPVLAQEQLQKNAASRFFRVEDSLVVPLYLPLGMERQDVLVSSSTGNRFVTKPRFTLN